MSEEIESIVTDEEIESNEDVHVELSARDQIFAQREAELLEEAGDKPDQDEVEEEDVKPAPVKPSSVKVKINGVEEERSLDDLVASYQKSESADRRLQQAALVQQQVEQERQQLQMERQQFDQDRQQSQKPVAVDTTINDLRQQRKDAMEIGDTEEFDRLDEEISQYRTSQSQTAVDYERLTSEASAKALNQIQYNNALNVFKDENSSLFTDNVLYNMTMSTLTDVCKESSSYPQAFARTGEIMKNWISTVSTTGKPTESAMTDRETRKQSIQAEPGRLNVKSAPPKAPKEETASDIIANMRKSRGLPS